MSIKIKYEASNILEDSGHRFTSDEEKESLSNKMEKSNPTGTGALSINRKEGSDVGENSATMGVECVASGLGATAEGFHNTASGDYSHATGYFTTALGECCYTEGRGTYASGYCCHAEGYGGDLSADADGNFVTNTQYGAKGKYAHIEGYQTTATGSYTHAEGFQSTATADYAHSEGFQSNATAQYAYASGNGTAAKKMCSHCEGSLAVCNSMYGHLEGFGGVTSGTHTHGEGFDPEITNANYAHAEGAFGRIYKGATAAHTEGYSCRVMENSQFGSHAEGKGCISAGGHAEGTYTYAGASGSHAEGISVCVEVSDPALMDGDVLQIADTSGTYGATGQGAHSEGYCCSARGFYSHAQGEGVHAVGRNQFAGGRYNVLDSASSASGNGTYAVVFGNGSSDDDRSNMFTMDWQGNAVFAGTVGSASDRRLKQDIEKIPLNYYIAWHYISPVLYKYINNPGVTNVGVIAQDLISTLEKVGIDWRTLGIINETPNKDPETGEVTMLYSVSYEQLSVLTMGEAQYTSRKLRDYIDRTNKLTDEIHELKDTVKSLVTRFTEASKTINTLTKRLEEAEEKIFYLERGPLV
jgi:hypothetical protein